MLGVSSPSSVFPDFEFCHTSKMKAAKKAAKGELSTPSSGQRGDNISMEIPPSRTQRDHEGFKSSQNFSDTPLEAERKSLLTVYRWLSESSVV